MDIQTREAQFHQTEEIMEIFGEQNRLWKNLPDMDKAVQLASTPIEKARVESWRTGVWEYMKAGRAKYFSKLEK